MGILNSLFIKLSSVLNDIKLAEVILDNGLILQSDTEEFVIGQPVFVVDGEGNVTTAPEGEHKAVDGKTFVVDGEGILTEIRQPEATSMEPIPADEETELEAVETAEVSIEIPTDEMTYDHKSEMDEMNSRLDSMSIAIGELMNRIASLEDQNQELSKAPAAVSLSAMEKSDVKLTPEQSKINRLKAMADNYKN